MLAACAETAPDARAGGGPTPTPTAAPSVKASRRANLDPPPPVTVRFFDQSIDLSAWTYCYGNACVDGAPPVDPPT